MNALWIVLAVLGVTAAVVVFYVLSRVLAAARQLQRNVDTLGQSVSEELKRLGGDSAALGESIDKTRRR